MRTSTIGLLSLILAGFALVSGIEWLFVVFVAVGLAFMFAYKEAVEVPHPAEHSEKPKERPKTQVIVVEAPQEHHSIAEEMEHHIRLEQYMGHGNTHEDIHKLQKDSKKLKRESEHLKHESKHLKKEIKELEEKLHKKGGH